MPDEFNNAGLFEQTGGTGVSNVSAEFNNSGSVLAESGTLSLNGGGTESGGFSVTANNTLQFGRLYI